MKRMPLLYCILFATLLTAQAPQATAVKREGQKTLLDADRLQVRETQLALAQAHIARLQAELEVSKHQMAVQALEAKIVDLIAELRKSYGCGECQLNSDFTWKKPDPSTETETTPAPPEASGQSSNKE